MADERSGENPLPPRDRDARLARREARRRQIRRRRIVAIGSLLAMVVAVVAVISLAGGSGGAASGRSAKGTAAGKKAGGGTKGTAAKEGSGKVRNASPQPDWKPYKGAVPILEYHVLGQPQGEVPYPELYVGRTAFSKQMDWLEEHGYEAVTLEAVEDAWYHGGTLPAKPVVVSCASTAGPAC